MLQKNSAVAVQQPVAQSPKASGPAHPVQAAVGLWGCDYAVSAATSHRVPWRLHCPGTGYTLRHLQLQGWSCSSL